MATDANDGKTIAVAKEILQEYKKNNLKKEFFTPNGQFKTLEEKKIKNLQTMLLSEVKKIYLNYKTYKFLIYNFPGKQWDKLNKCELTYLITSKNNGKIEDFFKIDGFIEEEAIGNYDYNKQYFSIFIQPDFFKHDYDLKKANNDYDKAFPCFYIKYFNMNKLKQQIVFKFFPSIGDEYKNMLEYKGSEKLFLKNKHRGHQMENLFLLAKDKIWDEAFMMKILSKLELVYGGQYKNHEVYQIKTPDANVLILMMVDLSNNYVTFLMENTTKGTLSTSYFYTIIPNINHKNKYNV
jgi:hypothetical protein